MNDDGKNAKDCAPTCHDLFNMGVRVLAAWLILQDPAMPLDAAIYKASETFTDVAKRHGDLLATLPRADNDDEIFAALATTMKVQ